MISRMTSSKWVPIILMLPLILLLLVFALYPILYSFWLSLHNAFIETLSNPVWSGLDNYLRLIKDPKFIASITWSVKFAFISVSIQMILGIGIAQLFNRRFPGNFR